MMTAPERWPSDHLERNLLVGQVHYQRRQHVGRLDPACHQRFLDLRPAAVFAELERPAARAAGDRQSQVAGDWQAAHHQRIGRPRQRRQQSAAQSHRRKRQRATQQAAPA